MPKHIPGIVVQTAHRGEPIFFFVREIADSIGNVHLSGRFYETEELQLIARYFQPAGVFLDIGSNVGNHAIYAEKFLKASKVILIEPNPVALEILRINVRLNQLAKIDEQFLGLGLSDCEERVFIEIPVNNLGGARLRSKPDAGVRVVPGDTLFRDRKIDFIKLDAEAMELRVLNGMRATIEVNRPAIFVEVDNENTPAIGEWISSNRYRIVERFRRYPIAENYMLLPL
jgi:FkbM family methyltransferase